LCVEGACRTLLVLLTGQRDGSETVGILVADNSGSLGLDPTPQKYIHRHGHGQGLCVLHPCIVVISTAGRTSSGSAHEVGFAWFLVH
jgi:hypothetical protein